MESGTGMALYLTDVGRPVGEGEEAGCRKGGGERGRPKDGQGPSVVRRSQTYPFPSFSSFSAESPLLPVACWVWGTPSQGPVGCLAAGGVSGVACMVHSL